MARPRNETASLLIKLFELQESTNADSTSPLIVTGIVAWARLAGDVLITHIVGVNKLVAVVGEIDEPLLDVCDKQTVA